MSGGVGCVCPLSMSIHFSLVTRNRLWAAPWAERRSETAEGIRTKCSGSKLVSPCVRLRSFMSITSTARDRACRSTSEKPLVNGHFRMPRMIAIKFSSCVWLNYTRPPNFVSIYRMFSNGTLPMLLFLVNFRSPAKNAWTRMQHLIANRITSQPPKVLYNISSTPPSPI